ncbi:hypothetical protein KIV10_09250 [Aequorivita echinoideorum]|uniref:Putative beta-lactamase-inhibitor-like PepSY-like domain-containing protein n=2 Tax=Aequorivita echinoideorum TaxID=1549647 RepID=A0ABS5S7L4_9FLAO|nr:hypothetical protein [Aequorivita echinoideorum]
MTRILFIFLFFTSSLLLMFTGGCKNTITPIAIPSVVKNTFKSNFPDAVSMEWEMRNSIFEVDFEVDGVDYAARLDNTGKLLAYKYDLSIKSLPQSLTDKLSLTHSISDWDDAEVVVENSKSFYQLEIENFFTNDKLILDNKGNLVETLKYWN